MYYRRDLITKTYSEKIKHPLHYLLVITPLLKYPIVKWFCGLHTRISYMKKTTKLIRNEVDPLSSEVASSANC